MTAGGHFHDRCGVYDQHERWIYVAREKEEGVLLGESKRDEPVSAGSMNA
ncbi:MAG: hypothetical protein INR69_02020 [Mucilaginibacter polytrichastri]|nr:hypothetical protein [Mucilaginibacter polytrichastri]